METAGSAKTPVPFYRTTQYSILETKLAGLEGVLSTKLGRDTVYPDCGFSWFSSVTKGKILDQYLDATTTSSQILSKPSVIPPSDNTVYIMTLLLNKPHTSQKTLIFTIYFLFDTIYFPLRKT
jgi:hypothetical protein